MDQEEVNTAWQNLLDAMANLMLRPDKSLLEDLIAQAESLRRGGLRCAELCSDARGARGGEGKQRPTRLRSRKKWMHPQRLSRTRSQKLTASGSGDDQQSGGQQGGDDQQAGTGRKPVRNRKPEPGVRQPALQTIRVQLRLQERRQLPTLPQQQKSVKSGDSGNYILWCAAMVLAAGAAAAAYRRRRQK